MPTISGIIVSTGTEADGRRAFSDVIDELSRPVDASDTTTRASAADAFRAAVRTMNRKGCWPWEILDEEITLSNGIAKYTVSGPIKKQIGMHILTASGGTPKERLAYVPYDVFMESYDLTLGGCSAIYTIPNMFETGQVQIWPTPANADFARFTYYRVTPAPRDEAEPVEVPDFAIEVYMAYAWLELAKRMSSMRAILPVTNAEDAARRAFREISTHLTAPGDRVW